MIVLVFPDTEEVLVSRCRAKGFSVANPSFLDVDEMLYSEGALTGDGLLERELD